MKIDGQNFNFVDTLNSPITVPDCFVMRASKIRCGNGEAKLYIASKTVMYPFFGNEGFIAKCFLLKTYNHICSSTAHLYSKDSRPLII